MSKPFNFTLTDLERWMKPAVTYVFAVFLVLLGAKLSNTNMGEYSAGVAVIGGMLLDAGRRFLSDTTYGLPSNNNSNNISNPPTP